MVEISKISWIFTSLVSIIIIIIGWCVLYNNAKKIATRAETKSILDRITEKIDETVVFSTDFWLLSNVNDIKPDHFELLFLNRMTQIFGCVTLLKSRGLDISYEFISTLLELSTLDCEKIKTTSKSKRQIKAYEINEAAIKAIEHIYDIFHSTYIPSK